MNIVEHIKEIVSPSSAEDAKAWAAQWFSEPQRVAATGVVQCVMANGISDMERLTPDARLIEDLGLNELQQVQLMLAVDQRFNLEISDGDAKGIQTIAQLIECVHLKMSGPPASTVTSRVSSSLHLLHEECG